MYLVRLFLKNLHQASTFGKPHFLGRLGALPLSRPALNTVIVALSGVLVMILVNLSFEVSMAGVAAIAFAHAYLIIKAPVFATFAVALICLGLLLRTVSGGLSAKIVSFGMLILLLALVMPHLMGDFPYGKDAATHVISLGTRLQENENLGENFQRENGGKESIFLSAPVSPHGHRYVALNRLGCSASTPHGLVAKIEADLSTGFPILIRGTHGDSVTDGNKIYLGILPWVGDNPVECRRCNAHCFALRALPGHWLEGTAYHGIVRDGSGSLWLFQYGAYEEAGREPDAKQLANYPIADKMWGRMAENITKHFRDEFPLACK